MNDVKFPNNISLENFSKLFDVPINDYMQQRSPREYRGSILAASNFLTFSGVVLSTLLFNAMHNDYSPGSLVGVEVLVEVEPSPSR